MFDDVEETIKSIAKIKFYVFAGLCALSAFLGFIASIVIGSFLVFVISLFGSALLALFSLVINLLLYAVGERITQWKITNEYLGDISSDISKGKKKTSDPYSSENSWVCPKCGEKNNVNAKNCIKCFAENPRYSYTNGFYKHTTSNKGKVSEELKPWVCPNCGEENRANVNYCVNCYTARETNKNTEQQGIIRNEEPWICPKCGEKNNANAKNCINCFEENPKVKK